MSLSPRAVALDGLGFGARLVALDGLWDIPLVQGGATHRQHAQFRAVIHAYFKLPGAALAVDTVRLSPEVSVSEELLGQPLLVHSGFLGARADAANQLKGVTAVFAPGVLMPATSVLHGLSGLRLAALSGRIRPAADVTARFRPLEDVFFEAGELQPTGIENPTEEELAVLALQLARRAVDNGSAYE